MIYIYILCIYAVKLHCNEPSIPHKILHVTEHINVPDSNIIFELLLVTVLYYFIYIYILS